MDVTRDNFAHALREFRAAVAACDFAAMDMEMTGLYEDRARQPSRDDSLDQRYAKLKQSVESYAVTQVGICLFTWVGDGPAGYYEARPFNFNVFPCSSVGAVPVETHFGCKNTAFEFLARNSFDFNKWIYHGVPYLSLADAERIRAERTSLLTKPQPRIHVDDNHRAYVSEVEDALRRFVHAKGRTTMHCETANSYQRKLVYDMVARYKTLGTRSRIGGIEVFKGTRKAMAQHVAYKIKALTASIDDARGFAHVIDLLSAARKPVVGHNMLLDVMHAYAKFHCPLPASRAAFARCMARFLPVLIDTKYIIESTPAIKARYRTSNLDEIGPMLEREASPPPHPLIRNHPLFTRDVSHTMHEAGFDAYMTGATFIRLLNLEGELDLTAAAAAASAHSSELVLYRYINRLYVALGDDLYWSLSTSTANSEDARSVAAIAVPATNDSDSLEDDDDDDAAACCSSYSDDDCSSDNVQPSKNASPPLPPAAGLAALRLSN